MNRGLYVEVVVNKEIRKDSSIHSKKEKRMRKLGTTIQKTRKGNKQYIHM